MLRHVFKSLKKPFLLFLSITCIIFASAGASADPVEGCDPKVLRALNAKAQAKVAADVATTEQYIDKPDSVLAMTCFNQAAGTSAKLGGEIFSGDFTVALSPIITSALEDSYRNFGGAAGYDSGKVDYSAAATTLSATFNCVEMQDLWDFTFNEGVLTDVPYVTNADLLSGDKPAGGGPDFNASWDGSVGEMIFSEYQAAEADLPKPDVPDFSSCKTAADVLARSQNGTACP